MTWTTIWKRNDFLFSNLNETDVVSSIKFSIKDQVLISIICEKDNPQYPDLKKDLIRAGYQENSDDESDESFLNDQSHWFVKTLEFNKANYFLLIVNKYSSLSNIKDEIFNKLEEQIDKLAEELVEEQIDNLSEELVEEQIDDLPEEVIAEQTEHLKYILESRMQINLSPNIEDENEVLLSFEDNLVATKTQEFLQINLERAIIINEFSEDQLTDVFYQDLDPKYFITISTVELDLIWKRFSNRLFLEETIESDNELEMASKPEKLLQILESKMIVDEIPNSNQVFLTFLDFSSAIEITEFLMKVIIDQEFTIKSDGNSSDKLHTISLSTDEYLKFCIAQIDLKSESIEKVPALTQQDKENINPALPSSSNWSPGYFPKQKKQPRSDLLTEDNSAVFNVHP